MKEISLHILDIVQNSIEAKASLVFIRIVEDNEYNRYTITIQDNGSGMDKATAKAASDPFFTSRTTRNVGLGIPLFKQNAEQTGGSLNIASEKGKGTTITTQFVLNHIDRPPLGNIGSTLSLLAGSTPNVDFIYEHITPYNAYTFDTREVKHLLQDVPISNAGVQKYLREMVQENLQRIKATE